MRRNLILLGFSGMIILMISCASSRVQSLTKATQEALELVKAEAQRAIRLTAEKVKNYEVDPDIGKEIINNLQSTEKKVDEQLVQVSRVEGTNNREEILKFAEKTNVIIQSALTDLKSLNDLYDVATFSQFETATFFPTGGYTIPSEKMDEAKVSLEPIVQRIIKFIGDHPKQRFVAVIVCSGFSDESPVGKESPLYKSLIEKMSKPNPTRSEMNNKLSELRAKSIAKLLVDIIKVNEGNKMPQLSDLRESGAIEQDADMVMFLYRPEYYDITSNEMGESNRGETHVRIAKHRNGSLETIKLRALLHIQKFVDWDGDDYTGIGLPPGGNWKPVQDIDGPKLYIQHGSKMNDQQFEEEEPPV